MMSGIFALSNDKNKNYKYFYRKSIKNIFLPGLIFSLASGLFLIIVYKEPILSTIQKVLAGNQFYHMWYIYMLFPVYLLVPIVIRFKEDIGERNFKIVSIFFLYDITSFSNNLNIGVSFLYVSYLMFGYTVNSFIKKKSIIVMFLSLLLALITLGIMTYLVRTNFFNWCCKKR